MYSNLVKREGQAGLSTRPLATQRRYRLASAVTLGVGIFLIDSFTTLGSAVAVLYVLVIVLAGDAGSKSIVRQASFLCAGLTVASFVYVHGIAAEAQAVLRLLFSLAANLVTTALLLRRDGDRVVLEAQARLLELTSDAIFLRDASGRVVYWNKGAEDLFGWTCDEARGRQAHELLSLTFPTSRQDAEAELLASGQWEGELAVTTRDGRRIDIFSRWRLERSRYGAEATVLETSVDISGRKASEAALKASEHRFRTIFETLAVAIWEHDFSDVKRRLDGLRASGVTDMRAYIADRPDFVIETRRMVRITDVNHTALNLMGVPTKEEFFSHLDGFLPETDTSFAQCLIAIDEGHPTFQSETTVRSRQGRFIPVIVVLSFPPDGEGLDRIQASILDMTERQEFQEALEASRQELEHASRAAIIGEISASIAHEVNQPLSATMTFIQAAQRWLNRPTPDLEETRLALRDAVVSTEHAANVVRRVQMLLGKAKPDSGEVSIHTAITDALRLKQNDLSAQQVRVNLSLGAVSNAVNGDRILLQQAFLNIIVNAMQAMETRDPSQRMLTIETGIVGSDMIIRFTDSGSGLGQSSGEGLFKAFSSTKPNGMGLGLAMCRSIATAHRGSISIRNRPDAEGAIVEIQLPDILFPQAALAAIASAG
jgi:PAS domain S-box-containing protein